MSHLIYNVKTLVYVVPFSIIIVVYFSITIYIEDQREGEINLRLT
jgi:hypothetical protein